MGYVIHILNANHLVIHIKEEYCMEYDIETCRENKGVTLIYVRQIIEARIQ